MSKFDALYKEVMFEQAVQSPEHTLLIKPQIELVGDIVKRQSITQQPAIINSIMQGITNPKSAVQELEKYGAELPGLIKKIGSYIASQPTEHRTDIIELVRQSASHPKD